MLRQVAHSLLTQVKLQACRQDGELQPWKVVLSEQLPPALSPCPVSLRFHGSTAIMTKLDDAGGNGRGGWERGVRWSAEWTNAVPVHGHSIRGLGNALCSAPADGDFHRGSCVHTSADRLVALVSIVSREELLLDESR